MGVNDTRYWVTLMRLILDAYLMYDVGLLEFSMYDVMNKVHGA